ncbi:MAG: hypothetical protein IH840_08215 [Candidatus Heimdallarchaeota archaeon]|nr:hypothetical protein [Candidatus Heimdallarchaeota archaeon]
MEDDPTADLDDLFSDLSFEPESIKILLIALPETYVDLSQKMNSDSSYEIEHVEKIDEAIPLLLQTSYPMVILDHAIPSFDIIAVSNIVRNNNKLARIIIVTQTISTSEFSNIYNNGSINAVLLQPFDELEIVKVLAQQDAIYSIELGVTEFINEPPKLSKASFLALDPSLSFGDEDLPLNFVGLMIVSHTVPRYTKWFEETLSQDEYLLAGYLSSIAALGDDLFQNKESLKEINFGGISVIFRFHDALQFSFLVRNLTRHNYQTAETRISGLLGTILTSYGEVLGNQDGFLTDEQYDSLDVIVNAFDAEDEVAAEAFRRQKEEEAKKYTKDLIVLVFGRELSELNVLRDSLNQLKATSSESDASEILRNYTIRTTTDEDEAIEIVQGGQVGAILLDSHLEASRSLLDFADFSREMDPSLLVIALDRNENITQTLVTGVNSDFFDYISKFDASPTEINKWVIAALETSSNLKLAKEGDGSSSGLAAAKIKLRDDLEAYDADVKPELLGILITKSLSETGALDRVYDKFWESTVFDKDMLSGLVASLKSVGGEMFTESENIDGLELGGAIIYVRDQIDHLFIYFVKDVTPNTSVIVSKEVSEVTSIFADIINEAADVIPIDQLKPFFDKIANKSHYSFTELFSEGQTTD